MASLCGIIDTRGTKKFFSTTISSKAPQSLDLLKLESTGTPSFTIATCEMILEAWSSCKRLLERVQVFVDIPYLFSRITLQTQTVFHVYTCTSKALLRKSYMHLL